MERALGPCYGGRRKGGSAEHGRPIGDATCRFTCAGRRRSDQCPDQDPSESPRLAAADLMEVAGMMRDMLALAVKRGRPLPLNDTSYTSEDL